MSVCLYCGQKLTFWMRFGSPPFCSKEHRAAYHERQEQLALTSLMRTRPARTEEAAPEERGAAETISAESAAPAGEAVTLPEPTVLAPLFMPVTACAPAASVEHGGALPEPTDTASLVCLAVRAGYAAGERNPAAAEPVAVGMQSGVSRARGDRAGGFGSPEPFSGEIAMGAAATPGRRELWPREADRAFRLPGPSMGAGGNRRRDAGTDPAASGAAPSYEYVRAVFGQLPEAYPPLAGAEAPSAITGRGRRAAAWRDIAAAGVGEAVAIARRDGRLAPALEWRAGTGVTAAAIQAVGMPQPWAAAGPIYATTLVAAAPWPAGVEVRKPVVVRAAAAEMRSADRAPWRFAFRGREAKALIEVVQLPLAVAGPAYGGLFVGPVRWHELPAGAAVPLEGPVLCSKETCAAGGQQFGENVSSSAAALPAARLRAAAGALAVGGAMPLLPLEAVADHPYRTRRSRRPDGPMAIPGRDPVLMGSRRQSGRTWALSGADSLAGLPGPAAFPGTRPPATVELSPEQSQADGWAGLASRETGATTGLPAGRAIRLAPHEALRAPAAPAAGVEEAQRVEDSGTQAPRLGVERPASGLAVTGLMAFPVRLAALAAATAGGAEQSTPEALAGGEPDTRARVGEASPRARRAPAFAPGKGLVLVHRRPAPAVPEYEGAFVPFRVGLDLVADEGPVVERVEPRPAPAVQEVAQPVTPSLDEPTLDDLGPLLASLTLLGPGAAAPRPAETARATDTGLFYPRALIRPLHPRIRFGSAEDEAGSRGTDKRSPVISIAQMRAGRANRVANAVQRAREA
ncbi:MAG: hypothetical protein SFV54_09535 [Bryobacteraceae bacterium]|nr:hypothetical protein [Bryobacteraceae bacterium]